MAEFKEFILHDDSGVMVNVDRIMWVGRQQSDRVANMAQLHMDDGSVVDLSETYDDVAFQLEVEVLDDAG
jgi:hypothetical protein